MSCSRLEFGKFWLPYKWLALPRVEPHLGHPQGELKKQRKKRASDETRNNPTVCRNTLQHCARGPQYCRFCVVLFTCRQAARFRTKLCPCSYPESQCIQSEILLVKRGGTSSGPLRFVDLTCVKLASKIIVVLSYLSRARLFLTILGIDDVVFLERAEKRASCMS